MIVGREEGGGFEEFIDDMHRCFSVGTGTSTIDEEWSSKILFKRNLNVKYKSSHCRYLVNFFLNDHLCVLFSLRPDFARLGSRGRLWIRLHVELEPINKGRGKCLYWLEFRPGCRCLKELLVSRGIGWPFSPRLRQMDLWSVLFQPVIQLWGDTVMRSSDPSIDISRETLTSESLFPERTIRLSEIFLMGLLR